MPKLFVRVMVAMALAASALHAGRAHAQAASDGTRQAGQAPAPSPPPAAPPPAGDRRAWYDTSFWGGAPVGTRIYGLTVAEIGLVTSLASVGGGHGAVGVHYAERGGYLAQVLGMLRVFAGAQPEADRRQEKVAGRLGDDSAPLASGIALMMDGYSRSLGGDADGFNARMVWGIPLGRRLPWILDIGVSSCALSYHWTASTVGAGGMPMVTSSEVTKGGVLGFTVGVMAPLGPWAEVDGKVSFYLGGDREAEATLIANLTNRFYGGAGGAYWFGSLGAQLVGGVRL